MFPYLIHCHKFADDILSSSTKWEKLRLLLLNDRKFKRMEQKT